MLPSHHVPSRLQNKGMLQRHLLVVMHSLINNYMCNVCVVYIYIYICVLTVGSLGVRVDLRPGFVRHVGSRSLQLGQRVLHLRLALRREKQQQSQPSWQQLYHSNSPAERTGTDLFNTVKSRPQRSSKISFLHFQMQH